jgi:hypothetical protein
MMKKMKTAVTSIPTARARSPGDVKNLRDPGPIHVNANYWHLSGWLYCNLLVQLVEALDNAVHRTMEGLQTIPDNRKDNQVTVGEPRTRRWWKQESLTLKIHQGQKDRPSYLKKLQC